MSTILGISIGGIAGLVAGAIGGETVAGVLGAKILGGVGALVGAAVGGVIENELTSSTSIVSNVLNSPINPVVPATPAPEAQAVVDSGFNALLHPIDFTEQVWDGTYVPTDANGNPTPYAPASGS